MRIAFQDFEEWRDKPHAEKELGFRMEKAAKAIGLESLFTDSIDKIKTFNPDIVIPLHHFTPKLFDAYTIGCMWNPINSITQGETFVDKYPIENIKSYDAFGVSSPKIKDYLDSLCFKSPYQRDFYTIYPSSNASEYAPIKNFKKIAYIGSNWQLDRHKDLFLNSDKIAIYGPRDKWEYIIKKTQNYCGEVPFGSDNVREVYRENGIGLCFHGEDHLRDNIPSMRVFEMASAGVVIFADKLPFIEKEFGDSVLYIDTKKETKAIIEQIDSQYNWVLENKSKAREMAAEAHRIFNEKFTLEKLLKDIVSSYEEKPTPIVGDSSSVEIIVRTNGKRDTIKETIESLVSQSYKNLSITFVYWGDSKETFEKQLGKIIPKAFKYKILEAKDRKDRSYNLYYGLSSSTGDYVGICDDDDVLFKNHVESLVNILERDKNLTVAYSGAIMSEKSNKGEDRELFYFHDFKDFNSKSFITSNCYLIKRSNLPYQIFNNCIPKVSTGEDRMLLDLIHVNKGEFFFSERVTSIFTRDLVLGGNISSNLEEWNKNSHSYLGFLKESTLERDYLHYSKSTEKVGTSNSKNTEEVAPPSVRKNSRAVRFVKAFSKIIPFKLRRFILLLIKDLVNTSQKI